MFQGGGGGCDQKIYRHPYYRFTHRKIYLQRATFRSKNNLKRTPLKLALKCTITFPPCLKMQTPFLEALRPLHGQIKSLVMLQKIHPAKSKPASTMTGLSIVLRESL